MPNAWAQGYDGTGYAIAVIDGGFNLTHPLLAGKTVAEGCFSHSFGTTVASECPSGATPQAKPGAASNCPTGSTRCDHGTHVASIAVGNDVVPPAGFEDALARAGASRRPVYLKADHTVPYGTIVELIARMRRAGVSSLGLVTQPPEPARR